MFTKANFSIALITLLVITGCMPKVYRSTADGPISYLTFSGTHDVAFKMYKCKELSSDNSLGEVSTLPSKTQSVTVPANKPILIHVDYENRRAYENQIAINAIIQYEITRASLYFSFIPTENDEYFIKSNVDSYSEDKSSLSTTIHKQTLGTSGNKLLSDKSTMITLDDRLGVSVLIEELSGGPAIDGWPECT